MLLLFVPSSTFTHENLRRELVDTAMSRFKFSQCEDFRHRTSSLGNDDCYVRETIRGTAIATLIYVAWDERSDETHLTNKTQVSGNFRFIASDFFARRWKLSTNKVRGERFFLATNCRYFLTYWSSIKRNKLLALCHFLCRWEFPPLQLFVGL